MGDKFNNGSEFSASSSSSSSSSWSLLRSEEHTSELQSQSNLVCRLLLEKKKHADAHTNAPVAGPTGAIPEDPRGGDHPHAAQRPPPRYAALASQPLPVGVSTDARRTARN